MDVGYEPDRVRHLLQRTIEAIDRLDAISSTDPAAADALRTIRLTRANLEDHWIPALRDIERSSSMSTWRRGGSGLFGLRTLASLGEALADHLRPAGPARPLRALDDDRLVELILVIDALLGDTGIEALPSKYDLDVLAQELVQRVGDEPGFARRLLRLAPDTVIVGQLTTRATFPTTFLAGAVRALAGPTSARASAALDEHARSMSAVLLSLTSRPGACLDLLLDDAVLYRLATWHGLDATTVSDFTTAGMLADADQATGRLADGFDVVRRLTDFGVGSLDHGMSPGMARGLAMSMPAYFPMLADAIFQTGAEPVRVSTYGLTIGTYEHVANLFGAVMRDGEAAGALGLALGAFTDSELTREGVDLTTASSLTDVVHLTLLLDTAAESEQAQMVMEAAAAEARRRNLGAWIGVGANIALTASGAGATWRGVASTAIRAATSAVADVDAERLAGASIRAQQYQQIWMSTMSVALDRRATAHADRHDPKMKGRLEEFRRRLVDIEECVDLEARDALISDLRSAVDGTVIADFVDEIMDGSGLHSVR